MSGKSGPRFIFVLRSYNPMAEGSPDFLASGIVPNNLIFIPAFRDGDAEKLKALRDLVKEDSNYKDVEEIRHFCSEHTLHRYLRARQGDVPKAFEMLKNSISWLVAKKPWSVDLVNIEVECRTGKFYCTGDIDRWGRPMIVFDNTVQNTKDVPKQIDALLFNLFRGIYLMKNNVEKYVIVINLSNFTLTNQPPWAAVSETLTALQEHFPERLGTVILYQTPWLFSTVYSMVKPLIDPVTASKIVFVVGDVSAGSDNDKIMQTVIGPNWKSLCNAEAKPLYEGSSHGYDHAKLWPRVTEDFIEMRKKEGDKLTEVKEQELRDLAALIAKGPEFWPPREVELIPHSVTLKKDGEPAKKGWFW